LVSLPYVHLLLFSHSHSLNGGFEWLGLRHLRQAIRNNVSVVEEYLDSSPECTELFRVWEEHVVRDRNDPIIVEVCETLESLLLFLRPSSSSPESSTTTTTTTTSTSTTNTDTSRLPPLRYSRVVLLLTRKILENSLLMRYIYHILGSERYRAVNVILRLLRALVLASRVGGRLLLHSFDWTFKVFSLFVLSLSLCVCLSVCLCVSH
jgi:hypothetical protein